ncbi:expressed unknown protein [Seminavis robusta]|uniref:G-protein coupled receptors family 3 profile domain-containing protein n=1 Tax=Seminavis robusta TaxID=568900 RepID=A0A9N8HC20_9STRA|nr:expressed unknown protein [Seminavis robusta]|eukprot:Sro282_g107410.1 n/a (701) ;mRNA; f:10112-12214
MGPENRQKLANTFKRPTKWKDYCLLVSPDHCNTPDSVAQRPPTVEEESSYFVEGSYTGYFRATEKNNCDLNNSTFKCTGEFIDYPCGWTSYAYAMTHHLDIALEGSGDEPVIHGYSYREMGQIWAAANATRSHVMMQSWKPDTLYQSWVGTEAAWVRVDLPMPTLECLENRPPRELRCDPEADPTERFGSPLGTCDYHTSLLERMVVKKLHTETFDPSISPEKRSPGYDLIRSFTINELQMGQIMDYWTKMEDPREATCQWVVDNFDTLVTTVPLTYPRTIKATNDHLEGPLFYSSLTLAILAIVMVVMAAVVTYWKRGTKAIQFAQIEFLWIILTGLLMVSIGSMIMVLPVHSDGMCVATVWLVVLGYTFELIPLLVKVSALNKLMRAAKKMKRVKLERSWLFGAVFAIAFAMVVFLVVWTAVDPVQRLIAHELTTEETEAGETIVAARYYCASESDGWRYTWVAVNMAMLICATVLAVQTRNVRDEVNESLTMSLMIYAHFLFMVLRMVLVAIESIADIWQLPLYRSIVFSLDAMFSCGVYFLPKFFPRNQGGREVLRSTFRSSAVNSQFRDSVMTAPYGLSSQVRDSVIPGDPPKSLMDSSANSTSHRRLSLLENQKSTLDSSANATSCRRLSLLEKQEKSFASVGSTAPMPNVDYSPDASKELENLVRAESPRTSSDSPSAAMNQSRVVFDDEVST